MTKRQFLVILYLLVGIIPLTAQTFTEQKKNYPVSADGNKYVVSGFTPFSDMQDENIYANALLWIVKNVCPQLREGIAEVNVPAKNSDTCLAGRLKPKEYLLLQSPVSSKGR